MQSLIKPGFDAFLCHAKLMGGDADMTNLALLFGFQHTLVHAGTVAGTVALVDTVELVDVQIVGFQEL